MWILKPGDIVFSLRITPDFRYTATKLTWKDNDPLLQRAFDHGIIFKYGDQALALARELNKTLDIYKQLNEQTEKIKS